jgi:lipopolysaccharide assembly outer membrane protein LptD (OstA)
MSLKKIELDGIQMEYQVFVSVSEFGEHNITQFYIGTKTTIKRKYCLFGKKIIKVEPFNVFTLYINIEDPNYTKKDIRELIERELALLGRKSEIERGEIV